MRIGLFDSGIGGLTVARSVKELLPSAQLLYLGDTARTPYGTKSPETIARYACECADYLVLQGIDALVVACNTASSVALEALSEQLSVPVVGVISGACRRAAELSASGNIGVLGTDATIRSGAYQTRLAALRPSACVSPLACPLFVPIVEEGLSTGPVVDSVVAHHLEPLLSRSLDTVILACTHYPLLTDSIRSFLGDTVQLIECGRTTAEDLALLSLSLPHTAAPTPATQGDRFFVTDGLPRMQRLVAMFFPELQARVEQIPSF